MAKEKAYDKSKVLELIFMSKYNESNPQDEIPFTRSEVREGIIKSGGTPPDNLNNFLKDLTRYGSDDSRSPMARKCGYRLREGSHTESMGEFFKPKSDDEASTISVDCPGDLEVTEIEVEIPNEVIDEIRPDEGGLLSALEYGRILDVLFEVPQGHVKRIQAPVKVQPYEMDGFYVFAEEVGRIAVPCEAKSKGRDKITMNQIIGIAEAAIKSFHDDLQSVVPLGLKILSNGDVFIVEFPRCYADDLPNLKEKLTSTSWVKQRRFRMKPKPTKW